MATLIQDLKFGLRMLAKNPGFTAVAVLTLALGIGATTAMLSVVECAVLDAFPFPDIHRVVTMVAHDTRSPEEDNQQFISSSELVGYQEHKDIFDAVMGQSFGQLLLTDYGPPLLLGSAPVNADYFHGFGIPALIGRTFGAGDFKPGAPAVVMLHEELWRSKFNGDPGVVGRTINLNHQLTTIVGVVPRQFKTFAPDVLVPALLPESKPPEQQTHFVLFARLRRGVSIEQANSAIAVLADRFAKLYPMGHPKERTSVRVESITTAGMHKLQRTLYVLLGAVGLLMLIACVNVANLLLARATTRAREIAIRASLGASRARLVRQFLIESLLIALAGAGLGCLLAWEGLPSLLALVPYGALPTQAVVRINVTVLLFTVAVALLSTVLFGLAPALYAAKKNPQHEMQETGRGAGESRAHGRLRGILVVAEVALSLVLLSGAALLIRTFSALEHVDLGYSPDNILCAGVMLPQEQYKTREQRNQFSSEMLRRVRALHGVISASVGFVPGSDFRGFQIEVTGKPSAENWHAQLQVASDRHFETLGIQLLQGRDISDEDFTNARKVAVVNRAFVEKYLGSDNPLGRQVKVPELGTAPKPYTLQSPTFEIIGVAGNVRGYDIDMAPQPAVYIPQTVLGSGVNLLLVRTAGEPTLWLNQVRREVAAINKDLPVTGQRRFIFSLRDVIKINWSYAFPRFVTAILTTFAALGLVLVSVGVFSVLSFSVSRRTNEIGIRMALGAQRPDVVRMVILGGIKWLALGIAVGVPVSIALVRVFQNRIWALKSSDPLTLAAVALLLAVVGLIACYIPARRATKVDPMVALRYE